MFDLFLTAIVLVWPDPSSAYQEKKIKYFENLIAFYAVILGIFVRFFSKTLKLYLAAGKFIS